MSDEEVLPAAPRLLRYRLVESLVPLAEDATNQIAYATERHVSLLDVAMDFAEWTIGFEWAPHQAGLIPDVLSVELHSLADELRGLAPDGPLSSDDAVRESAEWLQVRERAQRILNEFRHLGVPIPSIDQELLGDVSTVPESERG
jgi:hypothetical protein